MSAAPVAASRRVEAPPASARHWAEPRVRRWLEARGWRTLAENVRFRHGELDLVMLDEGVIVFVEVRQRRSERHGGAAASLDRRKHARLRRAAATWLAAHGLHETAVRFDAALVSGDAADARVVLVRDAF